MPGGRVDADFQEIENAPDYRTLSIPYPVGTRNVSTISVQGTHAIPEFNGFGFIINSRHLKGNCIGNDSQISKNIQGLTAWTAVEE